MLSLLETDTGRRASPSVHEPRRRQWSRVHQVIGGQGQRLERKAGHGARLDAVGADPLAADLLAEGLVRVRVRVRARARVRVGLG